MHDHRRLADPRGNLQIADERLALERNLDNRKRRLVMLRRFAEQAQRVPIGLLLARRAGDGITSDMAILERKRVEFRKLLSGCAGFGARIGLPLVGETDLAPRRSPVIAIEAGERIDHLLGILAANALERIDPAGAAHDLRLDLVERALLRGCRWRRCERHRCGDAASDQARRFHVGFLLRMLLSAASPWRRSAPAIFRARLSHRPRRRAQRIEARLLLVAEPVVELRERGLHSPYRAERGLE